MGSGRNIKALRDKFDLTQDQLAEKLGVTRESVVRWESDKMSIRDRHVSRMIELFGIEPEDIRSESYGLYAQITGHTPQAALAPNPSPRPAYAPLLGRVHAGNAQEPEIIDSNIPLPYEVKKNHEYAYFLEVEGDCMDKVYPEGCYILVDPHKEPINGSIAVVSIDGADYVMRRLYRGANTLILSPDSHSQEHEDIVLTSLDEHTVEYVGTVVWFQSKEEME